MENKFYQSGVCCFSQTDQKIDVDDWCVGGKGRRDDSLLEGWLKEEGVLESRLGSSRFVPSIEVSTVVFPVQPVYCNQNRASAEIRQQFYFDLHRYQPSVLISIYPTSHVEVENGSQLQPMESSHTQPSQNPNPQLKHHIPLRPAEFEMVLNRLGETQLVGYRSPAFLQWRAELQERDGLCGWVLRIWVGQAAATVTLGGGWRDFLLFRRQMKLGRLHW